MFSSEQQLKVKMKPVISKQKLQLYAKKKSRFDKMLDLQSIPKIMLKVKPQDTFK